MCNAEWQCQSWPPLLCAVECVSKLDIIKWVLRLKSHGNMFRSKLRSVVWVVSTLDILWILYLTLVWPKLECTSTVCNSVMCIDTKKPEHIQWKFAALCQYHFFTHDLVTYADFLKFLNHHTLKNKDMTLMHYFYLCSFRFKMLPVCFGYYWYSSSSL